MRLSKMVGARPLTCGPLILLTIAAPCASLYLVSHLPPPLWPLYSKPTLYEVTYPPGRPDRESPFPLEIPGPVYLVDDASDTPIVLARSSTPLSPEEAVRALDWLIESGFVLSVLPSHLQIKERQILEGVDTVTIHDRGLWVTFTDAGLFPQAYYREALLEFTYRSSDGSILVTVDGPP